MTSGAIVVIVPKVVIRISAPGSISLENPKSAILYIPLCDNIFSAFKSRCTILWLCNSAIPFMICLRISIASFSGILNLVSIYCWRVPPLQYSITIILRDLLSYVSKHLIRLSPLHNIISWDSVRQRRLRIYFIR